MDPYKTHGAFSWSELITPEPKKAAEFYGSLFGWKVEVMNVGTGDYLVVKAGESSVGGIMAPPMEGIPPNWGSYVTVSDVDATAKQAVELGGKLLVGPMDIPTVGRMAVLQDPQGAVINAITYSAPST